VIISAYATAGETWSRGQNEAADRELYGELKQLAVWLIRVEGYSLSTGHSEPSWAFEVSLATGRALGGRFHQDVVFHVKGDDLSVTGCEERCELAPVGPFREKVDVGGWSESSSA
jgi:hypothetical protein